MARVYLVAAQDRWDVRGGREQSYVWIWQWSAAERAPERCGQQVSLVPAKLANGSSGGTKAQADPFEIILLS